jgi:hypothetical protein
LGFESKAWERAIVRHLINLVSMKPIGQCAGKPTSGLRNSRVLRLTPRGMPNLLQPQEAP